MLGLWHEALVFGAADKPKVVNAGQEGVQAMRLGLQAVRAREELGVNESDQLRSLFEHTTHLCRNPLTEARSLIPLSLLKGSAHPTVVVTS
jgi:hypothetical protein